MPLHVSTTSSGYTVEVERWGSARELVWSDRFEGEYHAVPENADADGCDWPTAVEIPVGIDWGSGFYLVTLRADDAPPGKEVSHAGFVVRAGTRRQRALLVLATNTWNAYNTWGGKSLYTGGNAVSFRRPFARGMLCRPEVDRDDRKARPRRWGEEPDSDGTIFQAYRTENNYPSAIGSTGWFTHERRFAAWAEARGHSFDYAISSDLKPALLEGYDLVVSVGHDEYWSAEARETVEAFVAAGGNLASFSGNTMFWQVRLEGDEPDDGLGHRMVCHKYSAEHTDPIVAAEPTKMSGMWCDPLVGRPEWRVIGAGSAFGLYHRFGQATPRAAGGFTVYRPDHWLFAGSDLRYGDLLGGDDGVVGYETVGCRLTFDEYQQPVVAPDLLMQASDLPTSTEIVAFAPSSNLGVGEYPASIAALSDQGDLEFLAQRLCGKVDDDSLARIRHGNAVMLVCSNGAGEVVTVGSTDWVFGLDDPAVALATENVLARYC